MKGNHDVFLVILVMGSFVFTSVQTVFVRGSHRLTQEEAIEISRNTPIVLEGHMKASYCTLEDYKIARPYEIGYWSVDYIRMIQQNYPRDRVWGVLPDDHGVWRVHWWVVGSGYSIVHFLDEWTGEIVSDSVYTSLD